MVKPSHTTKSCLHYKLRISRMYLKRVDGTDLPGLEHAVAGRVLGEQLAGDGKHGKTAVLKLTKLLTFI